MSAQEAERYVSPERALELRAEYQATVLVHIKKYYDLKLFTDLTIVCFGQEFRCHKIIVCSQSSFFEAACAKSAQEASPLMIDLKSEDPYYVSLMIEFLYNQGFITDFGASPQLDPDDPNYVLRVFISLYILGEKYGIPALCKRVSEMFRIRCHSDWYILQIIPLVYQSNTFRNPTLRYIIASEVTYRSREIAAIPECKGTLMALVHEIKGFREDLVEAYIQESKGPELSTKDSDASISSSQLLVEEIHRLGDARGEQL